HDLDQAPTICEIVRNQEAYMEPQTIDGIWQIDRKGVTGVQPAGRQVERVVHERRIRKAFRDATPHGVPAFVRCCASPREHEPGVLFGLPDAWVVQLVMAPNPTGIVSVDDGQQLIEAVFHRFIILAPRPLYWLLNWFSISVLNREQNIPAGRSRPPFSYNWS